MILNMIYQFMHTVEKKKKKNTGYKTLTLFDYQNVIEILKKFW